MIYRGQKPYFFSVPTSQSAVDDTLSFHSPFYMLDRVTVADLPLELVRAVSRCLFLIIAGWGVLRWK